MVSAPLYAVCRIPRLQKLSIHPCYLGAIRKLGVVHSCLEGCDLALEAFDKDLVIPAWVSGHHGLENLQAFYLGADKPILMDNSCLHRVLLPQPPFSPSARKLSQLGRRQ